MLRNEKTISSNDFSHLNVHGKVFVSFSLCPYYRYIWAKCKDLQIRRKIYRVFCLGGTIVVKVTKPSSARKIFHECDILDLDTDDVWKRLDLVLSCKQRLVLISALKCIYVIENFAPFTHFPFTTFPAFCHSTPLSRDSRIKNKDGHQRSMNCVNMVQLEK